GFEPTIEICGSCAISAQKCARLRVTRENAHQAVCIIRAELRSSSVRICPKAVGSFCATVFSLANPSEADLRDFRRFTLRVIFVAPSSRLSAREKGLGVLCSGARP